MRLGIRGAWVADNLRHLGSGSFYHLAFATHLVHPDLMRVFKRATPQSGKVRIYLLRDGQGFLVADGDIVAIHWFPELIRIHFIIGKVYVKELGEVVSWENEDYMLVPS